MNLKTFALIGGVLALAACGNNSQDPEKLKGGNFVTTSGDMVITLSFAPQDMRINGRALNIYNASYTANGDNIKFGDMLSTMMAGPESEMNAEQEYFQFMATVEKYSLNGDTLVLKNANGQEIVFKTLESATENTDTTVVSESDTETVTDDATESTESQTDVDAATVTETIAE